MGSNSEELVVVVDSSISVISALFWMSYESGMDAAVESWLDLPGEGVEPPTSGLDPLTSGLDLATS